MLMEISQIEDKEIAEKLNDVDWAHSSPDDVHDFMELLQLYKNAEFVEKKQAAILSSTALLTFFLGSTFVASYFLNFGLIRLLQICIGIVIGKIMLDMLRLKVSMFSLEAQKDSIINTLNTLSESFPLNERDINKNIE